MIAGPRQLARGRRLVALAAELVDEGEAGVVDGHRELVVEGRRADPALAQRRDEGRIGGEAALARSAPAANHPFAIEPAGVADEGEADRPAVAVERGAVEARQGGKRHRPADRPAIAARAAADLQVDLVGAIGGLERELDRAGRHLRIVLGGGRARREQRGGDQKKQAHDKNLPLSRGLRGKEWASAAPLGQRAKEASTPSAGGQGSVRWRTVGDDYRALQLTIKTFAPTWPPARRHAA